tara:strand:+ start:98 stop:334 length:237 start_codon:yes stop_codon:yes gene_type:complete
MIIFENIIPIYFFIAFCIGMFFVYLSTPKPKVIFKYPTPENSGKIIYKDTADICYKYKATEVDCPKDSKNIKMFDSQY